MEKINFFFKVLIFTAALFFMSSVFAKAVSAAPRLYLDPSSQTVTKDSEFEIALGIDAESNQVFGAEAKLNFPQGDIELKSITNGGFFSDFSSAFSQSSGTMQIRGYFSSLYETKSGSGKVATLKFLAKKDSGTGSVAFVCSGSGNDTKILNSAGTNILACGSLNQLNLTYSSTQIPTNPPATNPPGGGSGGTTTTTGSVTCGGYCGTDNSKCVAGLYCFYSYCRNPACGNELNCICPLTSYPTAKPKVVTAAFGKKVTVTPTPTPTPIPVPEIQIADITPYVPPTEENLVQEMEEETQTKKGLPVLPIIAGVSLMGALFFLYKKLTDKGNPPQVNPPANPPTSIPPIINNPPVTPPPPLS